MPRLFRTLMCPLALLGAPAAFATPIVTQAITPAAAPAVDEKIGEAMLSNSGDASELAELRRLTGIGSLALGSKADVGSNTAISAATGMASTWILSDPAQPGFFALKFGIGKTGASADTFFFRNVGDLTQLVWNNEQVQFLTGWDCNKQNKCQIERLSHYLTSPAVVAPVKDTDKEIEQGGGEERREVPEPAGLVLLAVGALAAAGARRRAR